MRIKKIKVYKFNELLESVQNKVLENLSDINIDQDWWEDTYEDAGQIGLDITEFDIYHRMIHGKFLLDAETTANNIKENHGEATETYKTAVLYLDSLTSLKNSFEDEDKPDEYDTEDIDKEFLHSLLQDYLAILEKEYDYLSSREAIIDTIEANDYEFEENGKLA
jgi:hypothetical protein